MEKLLCALLILIIVLLVWRLYYPSTFPFHTCESKWFSCPSKCGAGPPYDAKLSHDLMAKDREEEMSSTSRYGEGTNLQYYT